MASHDLASTREDTPVPARLDDRFIELKKQIIANVDPEILQASYEQIKSVLAEEVDRIEQSQQDAIPEVQWADVIANGGKFPEGVAARARHAGCVLIRGVVTRTVALDWKKELEQYTQRHRAVRGKPLNNPTMWLLYWTRPQMQARSHPDILKAVNTVMGLWHVQDKSLPIDLKSQILYADRFRIRPPGDNQFSFQPHLDSSSIERWEEPEFRSHFEAIFRGEWEKFDPWCVDKRAHAETNLYKQQGGCSTFRAMQGWLSLSDGGPGEGTLRVLPSLKVCTAYVMLRPFFLRERLDASEPTFPGAEPGKNQLIPEERFYPHLQLHKSMISAPRVSPGDYMFWHCDTLHDVERIHGGAGDSSVLYNASTPLCPHNIETMLVMRDAFRQAIPPIDFYRDLGGPYELERSHEDHGAREEHILSLDGRRALGLAPFDLDEANLSEGQRRARQMANQAMSESAPEEDK